MSFPPLERATLPGSFVAQALALAHPERVSSLVLIGSSYVPDSPAVRELAMPTLILYGDQDSIFDLASQHALLDLIPQARLLVYEDTGHALHWERPAEFAADLSSLVQGAAHALSGAPAP